MADPVACSGDSKNICARRTEVSTKESNLRNLRNLRITQDGRQLVLNGGTGMHGCTVRRDAGPAGLCRTCVRVRKDAGVPAVQGLDAVEVRVRGRRPAGNPVHAEALRLNRDAIFAMTPQVVAAQALSITPFPAFLRKLLEEPGHFWYNK